MPRLTSLATILPLCKAHKKLKFCYCWYSRDDKIIIISQHGDIAKISSCCSFLIELGMMEVWTSSSMRQGWEERMQVNRENGEEKKNPSIENSTKIWVHSTELLNI